METVSRVPTHEADVFVVTNTHETIRDGDHGDSHRKQRKSTSMKSKTQTPNSIEQHHDRDTGFQLQPPPTRQRRLRYKSLITRNPWMNQQSESPGNGTTNHTSSPNYCFWDTLGGTRSDEDDFSWLLLVDQPPLGYRAELGRVYFETFRFLDEDYRVGSFVRKLENQTNYLFRIISAFQATKSFLGYFGRSYPNNKEKKTGTTPETR